MNEKKKNIARSLINENLFRNANTGFMVLLSICFIVPMWIILVQSFVGEAEALRRGGFILFPETFDFSAYRILLAKGSAIYSAYSVTLFVIIVGTVMNLLFTAMFAYGVSKKTLPGRKIIISMVFVTMLFSGGLVPSFLLNKYLGLMDNLWVLILPGLISSWNMFILRNFFYGIPDSLEESALIDGATPITVFFKIIIPLSLPALATVGLFYAVAHWNSWFPAAIYINTPAKLPVQNFMRKIALNNDLMDINAEMQTSIQDRPLPAAIKAAVIMVSTVPILCIYPFIQKYFVKGVMVGSIKA